MDSRCRDHPTSNNNSIHSARDNALTRQALSTFTSLCSSMLLLRGERERSDIPAEPSSGAAGNQPHSVAISNQTR